MRFWNTRPRFCDHFGIEWERECAAAKLVFFAAVSIKFGMVLLVQEKRERKRNIFLQLCQSSHDYKRHGQVQSHQPAGRFSFAGFFLFQVRAETNKQTFFTTSATIYKLYTNVQTHAYVWSGENEKKREGRKKR